MDASSQSDTDIEGHVNIRGRADWEGGTFSNSGDKRGGVNNSNFDVGCKGCKFEKIRETLCKPSGLIESREEYSGIFLSSNLEFSPAARTGIIESHPASPQSNDREISHSQFSEIALECLVNPPISALKRDYKFAYLSENTGPRFSTPNGPEQKVVDLSSEGEGSSGENDGEGFIDDGFEGFHHINSDVEARADGGNVEKINAEILNCQSDYTSTFVNRYHTRSKGPVNVLPSLYK